MKKIGKKLTLILILCLMMTTLTGCLSIDEIRGEQAFWMDAEKKTISWKGEEYNLLFDENNENYYLNYSIDSMINVTDQDVPTLLAFFYGEEAYASGDERLICVGENTIYCKSEIYDEIKKMTESEISYDRYTFDVYGEFDEMSTLVLTKEESLQFETILKEAFSQKRVDIYEKDFKYIGDIYPCSSDGLFLDPNSMGITIYRVDGQYYVEDYDDYADAGQFPVPKNYADDMENLFSELII